VRRIGLISDVHGNALALDAVLAELERDGIDEVVCLGDVAVGPQARASLDRVRDLGCPVVMGNWDAWFLEPPAPPEEEIPLKLHEIAGFWAAEIGEQELAFMHGFLPRLELPLDGGEAALCFHGSPGSYDDWIFSTTPDDELGRLLGGYRAAVLIGGHTHVPLVRRFEHILLVNPGSVGLPFADWWPDRVRIAPWAEYGILSSGAGRLHVELRRTSYDVEAFLQIAVESGMPHAQWWVDSWRREVTPGG
jgi:predicted phosphodiesterase